MLFHWRSRRGCDSYAGYLCEAGIAVPRITLTSRIFERKKNGEAI
jgi:hypothetical protein